MKFSGLIDSHCHMQSYENVDEVIDEANKSGVTTLLNILEVVDEYELIKDMSQKNIYLSLGVHPLSVDKIDISKARSMIIDVMQTKNLVAIGETGIDTHYANNLEVQTKFFKMHIELANTYNKSIVIHSRQVEISYILDLLKSCKARFVFHCFTYGASEARMVVEAGGMISFSGISTFKNAEDIREAIKITPLESILVETDTPFLAPVPYRGKKNHPAYVVEIYKLIASIKNIDINELIDVVAKNFNKAFL